MLQNKKPATSKPRPGESQKLPRIKKYLKATNTIISLLDLAWLRAMYLPSPGLGLGFE